MGCELRNRSTSPTTGSVRPRCWRHERQALGGLIMKRLVIALCGLIALGTTAVLAETPWQEYVYADDGFAISAPAEPSPEQFPVYVFGGTANAHVYSIAAGND